MESYNLSRKAMKGEKSAAGKVDDVFQEFKKQGLGGTGWFGSDIEKDIAKELRRGKMNTAKNVVEAIGSGVEDFAKLAHFADKLKKGGFPTAIFSYYSKSFPFFDTEVYAIENR